VRRVDPRFRVPVIVGALALFAIGFTVGFVIGDSDDEPLAAPSPSPPAETTTATSTPVVETPTADDAPAITSQGSVLREGDRPVVAAASNVPCASLIEPGLLGECGEVTVAGQRVVWVMQQATTATGTPAFSVRIFSFVPTAGGWVEWLQASDPTGERWSDVNVVETDLTGDGVAELLVGFRDVAETQTLEYDIVGYGQDNVPEVLAHPDPAAKGSVVVSGGAILEYSALYPANEPVCCPSSYRLQTIGFEDAFFRVEETDTVLPTAVPLSQL
jgi:hypothetical protein